jgi:hypothetical protein
MKLVALLLAASALHFDITDARGKKPSGVSMEAGDTDADGWSTLRVTSKSTRGAVLVWPFDGKAKAADGPGSIPVIVIEPGDARALANARVVAAVAAGKLFRGEDATALDAKLLAGSQDPFAKGVGLLTEKKAEEAVEPLGLALKERERQLTRVPSEIYAVAMLYGRALFEAGKFDDAAVAYLKAINQRSSDPMARKARAEALVRAGKPEAAEGLIKR